MKYTLGTSAQTVVAPGRSRAVVQNLGPGIVYLDADNTAAPASGLQLVVGQVYEFPTAGADDVISIVSDTANTDVRVILVG